MGQGCSKRQAEESAQAAPASAASASPVAAVPSSSSAPLDPSCTRRGSESAFAGAPAASFPSALAVPDPVADLLFADARRLLVDGLWILGPLLRHYALVHVGAQRIPVWQECAKIAAHGQEETRSRASIVSVRHMAAVAAAVMRIAHRPLPMVLVPLPPPVEMRQWILRVDALFTKIAEAVPQMQLTPEQAQFLLASALHAGALPLVPVLMRDATQRGFDLDLNLDSTFISLVHSQFCHDVSLQPYLRLFEFGLDPTLLSDESPSPPSPLESTRIWIRQSAQWFAAPEPPAAMEPSEEKDAQLEPFPSMLTRWAAYRHDPKLHDQRCIANFARFKHAIIPAWRAHSTKVRSLLLEAAPDRLIPPLVDIVSRYLDHEGVPPESTAIYAESSSSNDAQ